jgi:hypothetical protein
MESVKMRPLGGIAEIAVYVSNGMTYRIGMLANFPGSAVLETLLEMFVWITLLVLGVVVGTPVILIRALLSGRRFFQSLTSDFRALFGWWWDCHPFDA